MSILLKCYFRDELSFRYLQTKKIQYLATMRGVKTLSEFIIEKQDDFKYATGELTRLLNDIVIATKIVNREVNKAGLANILGATENENIQGETQQKLDVFADQE